MKEKLSTEPYKGTRDFYPQDMAIQSYIFDTWAKTAESFGFERYDASVLEPSELYRSKTSEEIVNEQTYTFIDRGEREVTLRPEMTPTVARMVSGKRRELSFPLRWYSIPNVFRYERPQRGRLREHWQFNCDIFGVNHYSADVEMIMLAYDTLIAFGATPDMFEIRINDRLLMNEWYKNEFSLDTDAIIAITRIVDRKNKMPDTLFRDEIAKFVPHIERLITGLDSKSPNELSQNSTLSTIMESLRNLGISNVSFDANIARGFDYYTGMVFELSDTSKDNNRSLLGGGRYDNLTALFGGEPIFGIGFGMGDVTMRDFLVTHNLLPKEIGVTAPTVMVIPTEENQNIEAERIAQLFRKQVSVSVNLSDRKLGKKIGDASDAQVKYILVVGEDELSSGIFSLKNLIDGSEQNGTIEQLLTFLS